MGCSSYICKASRSSITVPVYNSAIDDLLNPVKLDPGMNFEACITNQNSPLRILPRP